MLDYAVKHRLHMMIVGNTGTGKTVLVQQALESLAPESECKLVLNFSAATSSLTTQARPPAVVQSLVVHCLFMRLCVLGCAQEIIEGAMEKKSKDKMGPPGSSC